MRQHIDFVFERFTKAGNMRKTGFLSAIGLALTLLIVQQIPNARAAQTSVTLKGIFYRPDGRSTALFGLADKTQKLVAEGRMIDTRLELIKIEQSRVQIRQNTRLEWLALDEGGTTRNRGRGDVSKAAAKSRNPTATNGKDPDAYRRRTIRLKSALKANMNGNYSDGMVITDDSVFDILFGADLKVGDVIKRVNGNGFVSEEDIERLAYSWKPTHTYTYTVMRDGKLITP